MKNRSIGGSFLHDLDFEKYPEEHCIKEQEIMQERGVDERIVQTIEALKTFRCLRVAFWKQNRYNNTQ